MIKSGNFKNGFLPAGIVPFNPGRILIQHMFAVENPPDLGGPFSNSTLATHHKSDN
jgi:hypothetical protein